MISIWFRPVQQSTIMIMMMMIFHSHTMLLASTLSTEAWKVILISYKLVPRLRKKRIKIGKNTSPKQAPIQLRNSRIWTKKWRKYMLRRMTIPAMSLYNWISRREELLLNYLNSTMRMIKMILTIMILHMTQLNWRKN